MYYIIQVTAYTGLMLLIYMMILRNRPMHKFNRVYLLSATVLPLILPLLKLPQALRPTTETTVLGGVLPDVVVGEGTQVFATAVPAWLLTAIGIYGLVAAVLLIVKVAAYIKMRRTITGSSHEQHPDYILLKETNYGPGSWGRYIFLPTADVNPVIIKHELVHIQLKHSRDLVFLNIMQALLWPNLFIHFLKHELVQVHEFQADAAVGMERERYSKLLLNSVFNTNQFQLAHSFIDHPIKRRIMMLYKNNKQRKVRGVVASVLAVVMLAGIVTLQSCEQKQAQTLDDPIEDFSVLSKHPDPGYNVYEYLGEHIKYPKDAKERGASGRIAIKFVVEEDGKINEAEIANKEYDEQLGQIALDVVSNMPDWKPGMKDGKPVRTYFTVPVVFQLDDEEDPMNNKEVSKTAENVEQKGINRKGDRKRATE